MKQVFHVCQQSLWLFTCEHQKVVHFVLAGLPQYLNIILQLKKQCSTAAVNFQGVYFVALQVRKYHSWQLELSV
jgi:hypothetical protein